MQQNEVVKWLLLSIGLDTHMRNTTVRATRRQEKNEILLTTDDGEYKQTWIISVRPTVRACEVAAPPGDEGR